jgi:hypothetical protein
MNKVTTEIMIEVLKMRIADFKLILDNEEKEITALKNLIHNKEIQKYKMQQAIADTKSHISKLKQT